YTSARSPPHAVSPKIDVASAISVGAIDRRIPLTMTSFTSLRIVSRSIGPSCLEHREAPVHVKRGAVDVGCTGRSQEEDRRGDLLGRREPAERDLALEVGASVRGHPPP